MFLLTSSLGSLTSNSVSLATYLVVRVFFKMGIISTGDGGFFAYAFAQSVL